MKHSVNIRPFAIAAAIVLLITTGVSFAVLTMRINWEQESAPETPSMLLFFGVFFLFWFVGIPGNLFSRSVKVAKIFLFADLVLAGIGVWNIHSRIEQGAPFDLYRDLPETISNAFRVIASSALLVNGKNGFRTGLCVRLSALAILIYMSFVFWAMHHDYLQNARSVWLYLPSSFFIGTLSCLSLYTVIKGEKAYVKWMPGNKRSQLNE